MSNDSDYTEYIRSLDNSQLVRHISFLTLTPGKKTSTQSTDPFDDQLDDVLAALVGGDTDDDTETVKNEDRPNGQNQNEDKNGQNAANQKDNYLHQNEDNTSKKEEDLGEIDNGLHEDNNIGRIVNPVQPNVENEGLSDSLGSGSDSDALSDSHFGQYGNAPEFGDYGTYFQNKHLKQQQSDQDYIQWEQEMRRKNGSAVTRKQIFKDCVIFVNGHTSPSFSEIHRLVILHGGKFLRFLGSKGAATHVICDRLTPRKKIQFKNYRVVKARWLVACVEKQELLDWKPFRLIDELEFGQKRLNWGAQNEASGNAEDDTSTKEPLEELPLNLEEQVPLEEQTHEDLNLPDEIEEELDAEYASDVSVESDNLAGTPEETPGKEDPDADIEVGLYSRNSGQIMDAKHPQFLKHFFANSRLHHLSSWKADLKAKFLKQIKSLEKPARKASSDSVILHIDFDCFFATASCQNYPHLDIHKDPIAVTHGGRSSDVASCNYVARSYGVTNGTWLGRAKIKCPDLIPIDYDFDLYEKYSNDFYSYLIGCGFDSIFPVSIDEVLVDATSRCQGSTNTISVDLVNALCTQIRQDIFSLTSCSVSIGASCNVLLAKLALRKAKPNGYLYVHENIPEFLANIPIQSFPGIGRSMIEKLVEETGTSSPLVKHIIDMPKNRLSSLYGPKTGEKIYNYCRGKDDTKIDQDSIVVRKSVSVDVNFGIRFDTVPQLELFLVEIAKELYSRLVNLGLCGSELTLRLARRAPHAPIDPPKYLGMGECTFTSKLSKLGGPSNDWGIVGSELKAIYRMVNIPVKELRGIAVTMNKLEDVSVIKKRQMKLSWKAHKKKETVNDVHFVSDELDGNIDWDVFEALPDALKIELKRELIRRGVREASPKKSRSNSPKKYELGSPKRSLQSPLKSYLQKVFPKPDAPEFVRVYESPSPKKQRGSPVKRPVKRPQPTQESSYSLSYDDSVLDELPSSVRQEVLQDIEYKKKVRRFNTSSMRSQVAKSHAAKMKASASVTAEWTEQQYRILEPSTFLGTPTLYSEMLNHVYGWIDVSFEQDGPHPDDVAVFIEYLRQLMYRKQVGRCFNLITAIETRIECKRVAKKSPAAIADWTRVLQDDLLPVLEAANVKIERV